MKRNLTINMFGTLFNIDEDAYKLLNDYINNLKAYFGRQEGGDEIVDDLEHRIAELLSEYKQQGKEAITKEHVEDVISRVGKPEEMVGDEDGENNNPPAGQPTGKAPKRLMRDPRDKMLGGVISGLSHYINADVTLLRIIVVLITLFSHMSLLLVYLIVWLLLPEAQTAEDFLTMEGKSVSTGSIGEALVNGVKSQLQPKSRFMKSLNEVLRFCIKVLKLLLYIIGIFILMLLLLMMLANLICQGIGIASWATFGSALHIFSSSFGSTGDTAELMHLLPTGTTAFLWLLLESSLVFLFVPVYCFIHHIVGMARKRPHMSLRQRMVWLSVWVVSLVLIIVSGIRLAGSYERAENEFDALHPRIALEENSSDRAWKRMYKAYEAQDTARFRADSAAVKAAPLYFECMREDGEDAFEKTSGVAQLKPGMYRLHARVFTNRAGCMAFATVDSLTRAVEVPFGPIDHVVAEQGRIHIAVVNKKPVEKWSYTLGELPETVVDSIMVGENATVKYGIRSESPADGTPYRRYLLYGGDYRLERVGNLPQRRNKK